MSDRFEPHSAHAAGKDPANDCRLGFVNLSNRESASAVDLPDIAVAVTGTPCDVPQSHAFTDCFARSRSNRLELHLRAYALDEVDRCVGRIRERDFLTVRVIEEPCARVADDLPKGQGGVDRISSESTVVPADYDVSGHQLAHQAMQRNSPGEVVARDAIIDVLDYGLPEDWWVPRSQSVGECACTFPLRFNAVLLAVDLRPSEQKSDQRAR